MARGKDAGTLPFLPKCHLSARLPGSLPWHVAREICCTAWRLGQGASSSCKDHELCNQTDFRVGIRRCHPNQPCDLEQASPPAAASVSDVQTGEAGTAPTGLARDSSGPGLGARHCQHLTGSRSLRRRMVAQWPCGWCCQAPLSMRRQRLIWAGKVCKWMALRQNLKARYFPTSKPGDWSLVREKLELKCTWGEGLAGLWRQIPVSVLLL